MNQPQRSTPLALGIVTLAVAFGAGVGTGALLFGGAPEAAAPAPGPRPMLFDDLDLTAEQRAQVDSILGVTRQVTDSVLEATRLALTARATEARREIETVLEPDQVRRLNDRIRTLGPRMVRRVQVNDSVVRVDTVQ